MARLIKIHGASRTGGFSLIEVMVAVVILATGLLALAALQGALARSSADAKARSAVMAALTSRMSEIRQAPPSSGTTWTTSTAWVANAATQAGTSDLQVVETIASWRWNGTTYVTTAVTDPASTFTRASLQASWTGPNGARTLGLASDISGSIYGLGTGFPVPDPNSSAAKLPVVRQDNPSNTAGVIPIVTGNQATAASNPQPIIEGADNNLRVGTAFDVLNYVPEGSVAKITKRFETKVIKCRCEFGAAGYSVAGKAQWPAVWDGTTYGLYATSGDPAGMTANAGEDADFAGKDQGGGKKSARLQSEQCTECCRDHHDSASVAVEARYDPEATAIGKYNEASGALTVAGSGKYVAACRIVRVDGLWRTTADMYQRHYGLLETTSVGGVQAKSGIPNSTATAAYQTYVKDYLSLYTNASTTAPSGAVSMFDQTARGLNSPNLITIATASTTDNRYLHGRGLYVDYLGAKARQAIGKCTGKSGTEYTECLLPTLPFTTVNLTEMAKWTASNENVLNINTQKSLAWNVDQPFGGRTRGISVGLADNNSESRLSNSGVAVSDSIPGAVDANGDQLVGTDAQRFLVGPGSGGGGGTGDTFMVAITGGGSNPQLSFAIGSDSGGCTWNGTQYSCPTNSVLPSAGNLVLANYNQEVTSQYSLNLATQCTYVGNGNFSNPGSISVQRPQFTNFAVTAVANAGTAVWSVTANAGKSDEVTSVSLSAIPKSPAVIQVTFSAESATQFATIGSCTYDKGQGNAPVLKSLVWNRSWQ